MLKLNYIGEDATYNIEFDVISENVVQIKGKFPVSTSGFMLSRPGYKDKWDYSAYTTVYREIDGGVQFSNDGSVYTPKPETDFDFPEMTPEEIEAQEQQQKEAQAVPTNAELAEAVMELAESISDMEEAIAELGGTIS